MISKSQVGTYVKYMKCLQQWTCTLLSRYLLSYMVKFSSAVSTYSYEDCRYIKQTLERFSDSLVIVGCYCECTLGT
jgi:hypothetical protein